MKGGGASDSQNNGTHGIVTRPVDVGYETTTSDVQ